MDSELMSLFASLVWPKFPLGSIHAFLYSCHLNIYYIVFIIYFFHALTYDNLCYFHFVWHYNAALNFPARFPGNKSVPCSWYVPKRRNSRSSLSDQMDDTKLVSKWHYLHYPCIFMRAGNESSYAPAF